MSHIVLQTRFETSGFIGILAAVLTGGIAYKTKNVLLAVAIGIVTAALVHNIG